MTPCDVVVPVYGGAEFLSRCLINLRGTLPKEAKVFIVDDATPEERSEGLGEIYEKLPDFATVIQNPKNVGFAASNNIGFAQGNSPYVCMLNSDTEPTKDWIEAMAKDLDDNPTVGVVGARLVFPPWSMEANRPRGRVQHAGVVFNTPRMPYHIFLGWNSEHPKVKTRRTMQAVTGACLMTRRELYEAIGGLDPKYKTGNFEDVAYCLEIIKRGYKVVYEPDALLYHFGSGSDNTKDAARNMAIFQMDWHDFIKPDDFLFW